MSLVPNRELVIHRVNEKSVVVFNPVGNQVAIVENDRAPKRRRSHCRECGRKLHEEEHRSDYFMLLDEYNRATPSAPASPAATPFHSSQDEISSVSFSQGYFERFFKSLGLLGRGSRAAVYHVEHVLENISIGTYALKKIPVGYNQEWLRKVLTEVNLLRQLSHPNLVRYNHVWLEVTALSDFGPPVPCAYLLQEYCDGGTLEDYVNSAGELDADEIRAFMSDIGEGIEYLHSKGLVHCDLKPSNCLLKSVGHRTRILVSDFGESQVEGSRRVGTGSTGTLEYCAPEVLVENGVYPPFSRSSDMFSVGMTLYFLCFSRLPYSDAWADEQNVDLLLQEVRKYKFSLDQKKIRPDLVEYLPLLKDLLSDPECRPSAGEFCTRLASATPTTARGRPKFHRDRIKQFRLNANQMRIIKLLSSYVLQPGPALHVCVVLGACELATGYSLEFFVAHFAVLLIGLLI